MIFTETQHCLSKVHCRTCRDLDGGRAWRRSLGAHYTLPDGGRVDFTSCPANLPFTGPGVPSDEAITVPLAASATPAQPAAQAAQTAEQIAEQVKAQQAHARAYDSFAAGCKTVGVNPPCCGDAGHTLVAALAKGGSSEDDEDPNAFRNGCEAWLKAKKPEADFDVFFKAIISASHANAAPTMAQEPEVEI